MQTKARTTYVTAEDLRKTLCGQLDREGRGGQARLAKRLKVSKAFLSQFLSGDRSISPQILNALGYNPTPHYRREAT